MDEHEPAADDGLLLARDADLEARTPSAHRGWHERGYLPHIDRPELVQHVIFRLHGSLPAIVLQRLRDEQALPDERRSAVDDQLDRGGGPSWLADSRCAAVVQNAILHFDGLRYILHSWCVMPNHVHVLVEPTARMHLGDIVKSWKSFTGRRINAALNRFGPFWAADYFDRYMRDEAEVAAAIDYIEANPVKAGLCHSPIDWPWSSASRYADLEVRAPSRAGDR